MLNVLSRATSANNGRQQKSRTRAGTGAPADSIVSLAEHESKSCRYCLCSDSPTDLKAKVCACRGDQYYVHGECLKKWQESQLRDTITKHGTIPPKHTVKGIERHMKCGVCQSRFNMGSSQSQTFSFDDWSNELQAAYEDAVDGAVLASAPYGNELNLCKLQMSLVPPSLLCWTHLTRLDMSHNKLPYLPYMSKLIHLTWLSVSFNKLRDLADMFEGMSALKYLDVRGNWIKELPKSIGTLADDTMLRVHGDGGNNEDEFYPPSYICAAGIAAIRACFASAERASAEHATFHKLIPQVASKRDPLERPLKHTSCACVLM